MLRPEGEDLFTSEKFNCAVVQKVLIFGAKTWALTEAMSQKLEGVHVVLLRQVTWNKTQRPRKNYWRKLAVESVLQAAGTQPLKTYIDKRQATLA